MTSLEDTHQGRKRKVPEYSNMDLDQHNERAHSNGCGTRNSVVQALLTDLYQITMAYAYWKANKCQDHAVFELFFRKNPFRGEFTIFAGLEDCLTFLENFQYSDSDIEYLRKTLPVNTEPEFFIFLQSLSAKELTVYAIPEGSVVFPRTPLMRVEGPLPIVQLVETTLLTLVNFASLITTNAARYRIAAGTKMKLFEFGLRRAQGPDGGLSASKYAFMGGFDATSNVLAGKLFNIPVSGTHAHAYVTSFSCLSELTVTAKNIPGTDVNVIEKAKEWRAKLSNLMQVLQEEANDGELAAFISFAVAFPDGFLALIDTYDVLRSTSRPGRPCLASTYLCRDSRFRSGLLNFCAVALMLNDLGYHAIGVRVDSGDLAYLSNLARSTFIAIAEKYNISWFADLMIIASNDINEETIISLNEQGHKINCFGIGTHLVTCQRQPALGCVYKMVEVNNNPRIKLSQDVEKITMPGRKSLYRLYGNDGHALIDLLQRPSEPRPQPGKKVLCRHPFQESKRAYVSPTKVESLVKLYWENGRIIEPMPSLAERRNGVEISLKTLRSDIKRHLNPTPYKVSVSDKLYNFIHDLWLQNAPIGELY